MSTASGRGILSCIAGFLVTFLLLAGQAFAVPAAPVTGTLTQPDGSEFKAKKWGDEWSHGYETEDGYSIVLDTATGNWNYAVRDKSGKLIASSTAVTKGPVPPGIQKHLRPAGETRETIRAMRSTRSSQALKRLNRVVPPSGTANIPVILINFSNTFTTNTPAEFNSLLFGSGNMSMKDYYEEVSYNTFSVSAGPGGIAGWYTAANNHDFYGANDVSGFDMWPGTLVREAVMAADATFNFAPYDADGDCYVDVVNIVHQGTGEEVFGSPATDIWSQRWDLNSAFFFGYSDGGAVTTNDTDGTCPGGYIVNDFVIEPERLLGSLHTVGVFVHEYGHALGLPDLYDTDNTSAGIGAWGLMAAGSWNTVGGTIGDTPSHISAWSKFFLGWVTPVMVSGTLSNVGIDEAATTADVYQFLSGTPLSGEYFLVENRTQTSFDAGLPAGGLAVWHIDGDTISSRMSTNTVNTSECFPGGPSCIPDHYGVALVQADNVYGLEKATDSGDPGDLFFPPCLNAFTGSTTPSSDLYNGSSTNVSITNINRPGPILSAKLSDVNASADPVVQNVLDGCFEGGSPNAVWNEASTNYGTPLCTEGAPFTCGLGGGTGTHSGEWWTWFGGITGVSETGSVDQNITIPNPSCSTLDFYLEIPTALTTGTMEVKVDGNTEFSVSEADAFAYPQYTKVALDLSAYGDNNAHNVSFESTTLAGPGPLNFFVDDVGLYAQFSDITPGFWAENYITSLSCSGVVGGFGDGTYRPTNNVSRAQMAAFIVRAVDGAEPADCISAPFPDVSTSFWACKYIKRAVDLGIVSGFPDGTYKPAQIVNRGQMAAFIIKGMIADGQLGGEPADCVSDPFPDVSSGHIFCKYINELVNQGIASGFGDGTYKPTQQVNRAQMSVFVGRGFLP